MNKAMFCTLACAIFGLSSSALAQPLPELCQQKEKEIAAQEASLGEIDKQIAELQAKLDELKKQKDEATAALSGKKGEKGKLAAKIRMDTAKKKRMCAPLATCAKYEKDLDSLKEKNGEMVKQLAQIRKAGMEQKKAAVALKKAVKEIEAEYGKLGCDSLVLGEDEQKTVDRCQQLFADWTAKQAELDKVKAAIKELKASYKKQKTALRKAFRAYANLQKKMRKTCSFSARLPEVDTAFKEYEGYTLIDKEIKEADTEVKAASRVKIIKPKIIEKKKPDKKEPAAKPKPTEKKPAPGQTKGKSGKGKFGIKLKLDAKGGADTSQGTAGGSLKAKGEVTTPDGKKKKGKIDIKKKIKLR